MDQDEIHETLDASVKFQQSPERVSTAVVRRSGSVGMVRVSPW